MPTSPKTGLASRILRGRQWVRGRGVVVGALVSVLFLFPGALEARTPAEDPDQAQPRGPFHLSYLDGDLQFESMFDWRQVATPARDLYGIRGGKQTNRQIRLEETFGLRFAGDILYPEFINVNADLRFGLDQFWSYENGWLGRQRDYDNGWLSEYNVTADFFSRKPVNFNLYARHENQRISREFLPSLNHEMWRYGGTVRWDNERFPMELTLETNRDRYTGNSDMFDDEDVRETLIRYNGTLNIDPYHQLRINAERSRIEEQYSGSRFKFKTTRNLLTLDDRIEFGSQKQHVFETIFEYEEDDGDLPRDHLNVGPQLTLNHTEAFATRYKYQYNRDHYESLRFQSHRFDFEPTLKVNRDLLITADAYAGRQESNEEMTGEDYGGLVRLNYHRQNRWGVFTAGAGYHYNQSRIEFDSQYGTVLDEVAYFEDPLPWFLARANVVPGTIVVTNLTRTRVFLPGRDYTLVLAGNRTGLRRIPFGTINNRDSVLVRYLYRTAEKATHRTHEFDVRIQQDFNSGWIPYYAANVRRQDIDFEGLHPVEPNNLNRHRLGLTYRRPRWSAGGEFEFNRETVEPYHALHVNADWNILNRVPHQLNLRAGESHFWFLGSDRRQADLFEVALDYLHPLVRRLDLKARAAYRYEHDDLRGVTNGIDVSGGLVYRVGQLTVSWEVEYDKLDVSGTRDDGVGVWVKVRRDFPNLLGFRP